MKRGSKKKTSKKTYKRKTYKRKTNRVKTNRVKTNRGKTNKRKNKNYRRKKGKSLKGGLRRYLRKKYEDYEDFKTRETPLIEELAQLLEGGTSENVASGNDKKIQELKGQIRELKEKEEEAGKGIKNMILEAIVEGKSFETYKKEERPEGDRSGLKKQWDEVLQILGNKVNTICELLGFDESEWKKITEEDSQNREANIRNILIGIDHTIQYQLNNPGKDGSDFGMLSSFLGE